MPIGSPAMTRSSSWPKLIAWRTVAIRNRSKGFRIGLKPSPKCWPGRGRSIARLKNFRVPWITASTTRQASTLKRPRKRKRKPKALFARRATALLRTGARSWRCYRISIPAMRFRIGCGNCRMMPWRNSLKRAVLFFRRNNAWTAIPNAANSVRFIA